MNGSTGLIAVLVAVTAVGACSSGGSSPERLRPLASADVHERSVGTGLVRLDPGLANQCRTLLGELPDGLWCPAGLPRLAGSCPSYRNGLAKVRPIQFGQAPEGYELSYCFPSKDAVENSPPRFLHLTFSKPLPVHLELRPLDKMSVGGQPADAFAFRGTVGFYEGHVVLHWSKGRRDFEATLHSWEEPTEAADLLAKILESGIPTRLD